MSIVVGLKPWLPWPLSRLSWWTVPVRAERLAALRIGLALVLLGDVLTTYLPNVHVFYGAGGLGDPALFGWNFRPPHLNWSLLYGVGDHRVLLTAMLVWVVAVLCLLLGFWTRLSAVVAWLLSTSFATLNPYVDNSGDQLRGILLFYLMLCPCGAAWSVDAWRRRQDDPGPVHAYPWPLRLLFVQMALMYFCNGVYKLTGHDWPAGTSLYYVLGDLTLARWSYAEWTVPFWLTRLLTWTVMAWEVSFPALMLWRWTRIPALCFGAALHLGIWISLEVGNFAPYALCLYLPLLPWERLTTPKGANHLPPTT
jgi:uncharacterized membrane protein YphA (DoxX/SURF4 family)